MVEVHRHKRVTETGKVTTVRHHIRSAPGTGEATRQAWEERAQQRYTPPPPASSVTAAPGDDSEPWWDEEDNPQQEAWMDEGSEKTDLLRESGYRGAIDQDGEPVDRWELAKTRARIAGEQEQARKRFMHAKTIEERDAAGAEFKALGDRLKALPERVSRG